jgi:hypothetical protein
MRAGHAEAVEDEQPVAGEQLARLGAAVERLERQPQELEPMRIELVVGALKGVAMTSLEKSVSHAPSTGQYYATKSSQNGLPVYNVTLPLGLIATPLSRPFGPDKPLEGNRRMNEAHALGYAAYVIDRAAENERSYTPALSLRSSDGDVHEVGEWIHEDAQRMTRGVLEIDAGELAGCRSCMSARSQVGP